MPGKRNIGATLTLCHGISPQHHGSLMYTFCHSFLFFGCPSSCIWVSYIISKGFPGGSDGKESACHVGVLGSIPGLGRSPGRGHGNPLQYSRLENPMGRGAWWATVRGVDWAQHDTLTFGKPTFTFPEFSTVVMYLCTLWTSLEARLF